MDSGQKVASTSSLEKQDVETYDVEDYSDEQNNAVPAKYRGTAEDKKDMSVLGKKQVLRVSTIVDSLNDTDLGTAQLQVHHYAGLREHGNGQLGGSTSVSIFESEEYIRADTWESLHFRSYRWWTRSSVLGFHCLCHRPGPCICKYCRNVFDVSPNEPDRQPCSKLISKCQVSNSWWSVPLGIRIGTSKISENPKLSDRYATTSGH